jgi:TolB protein
MSVNANDGPPRRYVVTGAAIAALALVVVLGFAFVSEIDSSLGDLDLFPTVDSGDTSISWTPDGHHIVVARGQDDSEALYRVNEDGGNPTRLTSPEGAAEDPAVSPDGKRVAYVAGSDVDVYVADADGSDKTRITRDDAVEGDPSWSPNGREIAFVRGYDLEVQSELYVMHADGTYMRRLTRGGDIEETPSWSPDGAWIAYEAYPGVYVIPAHRHGKRRLVTSGLASPVWSPDGERLAVVEDPATIKVVDLGSRDVRRLDVSRPVGPDDVPRAPEDLAWAPNGKVIAFTAEGDLYTVRLSDGRVRRLSDCVDGGDARCAA